MRSDMLVARQGRPLIRFDFAEVQDVPIDRRRLEPRVELARKACRQRGVILQYDTVSWCGWVV